MIQPISVFNRSSLVSNETYTQVMGAINNVSMPQFASKWNGLQAELTLAQPAGAWALWLQDDADVPGDLAYHFDPSGVPIIKVFVRRILNASASLCQAMDHEVKEALVDPLARAIVKFPGRTIVKEICDPVSGDKIDLGGGLIGANFVYPSWFVAGSAGPWDTRAGPWDARGLCTAAQEVRPGGYVVAQAAGSTQWKLEAMRGPDGLYNWRINYPGRLAYREKNR